jgi:hypothetical protein
MRSRRLKQVDVSALREAHRPLWVKVPVTGCFPAPTTDRLLLAELRLWETANRRAELLGEHESDEAKFSDNGCRLIYLHGLTCRKARQIATS